MVHKEDTDITRIAKDIMNQFAIIVRTARIHDPGNVAITTAIDKLIAMANPAIDSSGALTFEFIGEIFYVNRMRVGYSMEYFLNFAFLMREFKKNGLGSITMNTTLKSEDVQIFLKAFISSTFSDEPFNALMDGVAHINSFSVGPLQKIKEEKEFDTRKQVKKIYYNAVSYTKEIMNQIKSEKKIDIKKAKRIVESMVDLILQQEELLIGMTAIKDYDGYTFYHSVNVSILSVALGHKLGLNKKALTELGVVALFHDFGKMEIPQEILNKPTKLTEDDWGMMERHPFWGVRAILKFKGLNEISVRAAIVAFEHHLNYDLSGYPSVSIPMELDFYSRIVTLADRYDAMTSTRVYARIALPPDKALSFMIEKAGKHYDPLLIKFFIDMIGMLPVGTLLLLNTKELGLVFEGNATFPDKPRVLVVVDSDGKKIKGRVVDLTEKDGSGNYLRKAVKTLDPNKYNINLAEYLL
ncbi:MAG: HD domain-containing protein [Nitrospirae bacterium]|nr:HD domain-containing protein [Nitrospirota bacterium]